MLRKLVFAALLLTIIVVTFGAYVRLSDAGLGCPDWPGCYGQLTPEHAQTEISAAQQADPLGPVSMHKAWKEMTHRYLAATLGVLLISIAVVTWIQWRRNKRNSAKPSHLNLLPFALLGVVVMQGLLGKWTVTLLLKPAIVSSHLLGGMTILALLSWLWLRESRSESKIPRQAQTRFALIAARIGLILVAVQIALGGWVSTNYAALSCLDFPTCHGDIVPQNMDFGTGFHLFRELGVTADGAPLSLAALTAIHWTHRLGALIVAIYSLTLAACFFKKPGMRMSCMLLIISILLQISLGIANVLLKLPLPIAVAHNAGAVLLLITMVSFNYRLSALIPYSSKLQTHRPGTNRATPLQSAAPEAAKATSPTQGETYENLIA